MSDGNARGQRPARLVDVARLAGVSAQTVSNVLNERARYTTETRDRVLAAATELHFTRNRAARTLRSRQSGQIGMHVPSDQLSVQNTFTLSFMLALITAAEHADRQVVIFTHPLAGDDPRLFVESGMDGFVLCNVDPGDPRPQLLADAGIPYAVFGRTARHLTPRWVDVDNAAAMATLVDHLVERGRRRFAYIGFDEPEYWNTERLSGTQERLRHHDLALTPAQTLRGGFANLTEPITTLLAAPDGPDAVICASDSLARLTHGLAQEGGRVLGDDLALTGFDGLPTTTPLKPDLTTISLPIDDAARTVVDLVLGQLRGDPPPVHGTLLPAALTVRATT